MNITQGKAGTERLEAFEKMLEDMISRYEQEKKAMDELKARPHPGQIHVFSVMPLFLFLGNPAFGLIESY